ncbi:MAG: DUF3177 family protein [Cyanobacteria bacterium CRU_2_1]|nr:DUF3177 family protein [Cyanobacteria bacterium RU_5_0]NJR64042.1 DUF3177 family protein [Cyanobacteria bacterium CRU_2_1]
MSEALLRSLVWLDYRLAILFLVSLPIVLLIWAFVRRVEPIQRLLIIYWRVSSLLAITVYLMIGGFPFSFLTSILARVLIPISLWFWVDLNEEIDDQRRSSLKLVFTSWRWATSIYCVLGVLASLPFLQCAFSQATFATPFCQVWLEAPYGFRNVLHPKPNNEGFLGFIGIVGLIIYLLYFGYFVFFRLGKQGRTAVEQ